MPTNEKEINNYLFDQLEICEDALELIPENEMESPVALYLQKKKRKIERKLYQNPALPMKENT